MNNKDELREAITTLSDAIGFCQYEYNACQSEGLKATIDGLVKLRGRAQQALEKSYTLADLTEQIHIANEIIHSFDEERARTRNVLQAALETTHLTEGRARAIFRDIADILSVNLEKTGS